MRTKFWVRACRDFGVGTAVNKVLPAFTFSVAPLKAMSSSISLAGQVATSLYSIWPATGDGVAVATFQRKPGVLIMTRAWLISSLLIALVGSAPAYAKSSQTALRTAEFEAANTDTADDLTLAEYQTYIAGLTDTRFDELDADDSADISLSEFVVGKTGKALTLETEVFNLADADASGALSSEEFAVTALGNSDGEVLRRFADMDRDSSLTVSLSEYLVGCRKQRH
ncbi:hypothetical protein A1355_20450 [Methylomonas koyamae]|uniref:EF-hand domain-containing protein n=2 Tax=Methylococcaceae TaxID=403 RepID=A0A177P5M1_9GAMM|nr:hypothetical protein A1355_20450 [Methylomonas koyamae]